MHDINIPFLRVMDRFLHRNSGCGTSSAPSRTAFNLKSIVYNFISDIEADSPVTVVDTEKADMKTKTHFPLTQTSKPKWLPATPFGISDHPHS